MNNNRKLIVSKIRNGTVIDHIPAEYLFTVINILNLDKINSPMTFGTNLESKKLGKKADKQKFGEMLLLILQILFS